MKCTCRYGLCRGTVTAWVPKAEMFKVNKPCLIGLAAVGFNCYAHWQVEFFDGDEEEYGEHELRTMLTVPEQAHLGCSSDCFDLCSASQAPAQPVTAAGRRAALEPAPARGRGRGRGRGNGMCIDFVFLYFLAGQRGRGRSSASKSSEYTASSVGASSSDQVPVCDSVQQVWVAGESGTNKALRTFWA